MAGKAKPQDAGGGEGRNQPVDWERIWGTLYWKLQREFPGHPRFSGRAFGRCPVYVINGAVKSIQESRLDELRENNRVLANIGYVYLVSKGAKNVDRNALNDWDLIADIEEAKAAVPEVVAKTWMELNRKGALPTWAIEQINVKSMELAAL